jgi:F-type H+-transporting ATPase subunit delta
VQHDGRVAKRYANALFETAREAAVIDAVEEDLASIVALLRNNAEFRTMLLSPAVSRDRKLELVDKLFSDRVTALTMQALRLMLEKRREGEIQWVYAEFVRLRRENANILFVTVTSSEDLDPDLRARVLDKIASVTGKRIESEFKIDPKLIGGIRVAYENYVLDGSLKGELRRIREKLLHDVLKQS